MTVSFPVRACHSHYQGSTSVDLTSQHGQLNSLVSMSLLLLIGYESKLAVSSSKVRLSRRALGFFPSFPESIAIRIDFIYKLAMLCKGAIVGKSAPRNIELTLLKVHFRINYLL